MISFLKNSTNRKETAEEMGKLLSLLARDNNSDCCGPKSSYDIFLDFENAKPTINEQEVYDEIQKILIRSDIILEEIQCYKVSNQPSANLFLSYLN